MVPWQHVVGHAAEARQAPKSVHRNCKKRDELTDAEDMMRLERFEGSPHGNHVTVDPERYRSIAWETVDRSH